MKGIKTIVSSGFIHRDLKPANILIHQGVYKIADFGFSREVDLIMQSIVGTPM